MKFTGTHTYLLASDVSNNSLWVIIEVIDLIALGLEGVLTTR